MSVKAAVPLLGATLWAALEQRAVQTPNATMLIDAASGRHLSFSTVRDQALERAKWLQAKGIGPGAVVAWQLPTRIETALICFALARLGVVQVPVIHLYRERELGEVLRQSKPVWFICPAAEEGQDYPARIANAIAQHTGPAPAVILATGDWPSINAPLPDAPSEGSSVRWHYYTSGTSSRPKAVLHTDQSLMSSGSGFAQVLGLTSSDVGSIAYPFAHIGGVVYLSAVLASGMAVVMFERFVPADMVTAFRRYGVTYGGGSTAHYQALLAEQRREPGTRLAPSLKVLSGGGASKPAALFHQVKQEMHCTVVHAYGLTEAPISTSNTPSDSDEQLAHSDGLPLPGVELRIQRPDGTRANSGEAGEILLRGANLCRGYLDADQTREAIDENGFFHTGDLGLVRADGRLSVTGRIKDVIIRKGENISTLEIEELLLDHPEVSDVAVVGLPDEERGERVCAVVVPKRADHPLQLKEMQAFLISRQLMRQKIPEQLEIMATLPRNEGLQKVVKYKLREQLLAMSAEKAKQLTKS